MSSHPCYSANLPGPTVAMETTRAARARQFIVTETNISVHPIRIIPFVSAITTLKITANHQLPRYSSKTIMDFSILIVPITITLSLLCMLAAGTFYTRQLKASLTELFEDVEHHGTRIAVFGMTTENVNRKISQMIVDRTGPLTLLKMKRRGKPGLNKSTDLSGFEVDLEAGLGRTHCSSQTESATKSLPPLVVRPSGHILI